MTSTTAERNGTTQTERIDPVDTYKDAAPLLRRPFTPAAVKFKPQSVTKSGKTLVVAYIDARLVVERLNLVCPHLWFDEYSSVGGGQMWCHLTVDNIRRSDVGEGNGKALVSDALKRAGVRFGVGVSLYAVPQQYLDGEIKYLNDGHNTRLRNTYKTWLENVGIQAFGSPLDHGDSDESQGDAEGEAIVERAAEVLAATPIEAKLSVAQQEKVRKAFADAGSDVELFLPSVNLDSLADATSADAKRLRELLDEAKAA